MQLYETILGRYPLERCGDCGRGLNWIEIAFGQVGDPVCGKCLRARPETAEELAGKKVQA